MYSGLVWDTSSLLAKLMGCIGQLTHVLLQAREFDSWPSHITFMEIDYEIFSTTNLPLLLIQGGQLTAVGNLWKCVVSTGKLLRSKPAQKQCELVKCSMTLVGCLGHKNSELLAEGRCISSWFFQNNMDGHNNEEIVLKEQ